MSLLSGLGLSQAEARVYLTLLRTGTSSIRQVADKSGVNRGSVYDALKELTARGLVGFRIKGERRKYFAESPQKIKDLIAARLADTERLGREAGKVIPALMSYSSPSGAPQVRFYEDDEGIELILRDVLQTVGGLPKKEYYVYSSRALRQYIYRRFPNFTSHRVKAGIFVKVIAIGTGGDPVQVAERRFLAEAPDELSSSFNIIYGNKLAMISVSSDLTPYGVVIEEQGVAAMQRLLFNSLWSTLKS